MSARATHLLGLVVLCFGAALASAQDRSALISRVEAASQRARDGGVPHAERIEAVERAIAARSALLEALPEDAHHAIWLLDQAADTLTVLSLNLADTRAIVGLPDLGELDATHRAATNAIDLSKRAGEWIEDRFVRQQAILDDGGELAEGDRSLNRRLADSEQALRRPLLLGRALVIRAGADDLAQAAQILDALRLNDGKAAATRDVSLAIAIAAEQPDRAKQLLQRAADQPDAGALTHAEATLLLARHEREPQRAVLAMEQAASGPPFIGSQGLAEPALLVLAVEAQARVLLEAGHIEDAAQAILTLDERRNLGGTPVQRSAIADARLAALAERVDDWSGVSPAIVLRSAGALVARDRRVDDARASRMLSTLIGHFDQQQREAEREDRAWASPLEHHRAMELLARLLLVMAEREPEQPEANRARGEALVLVHRLIEREPLPLAGLLPQAATHALGPASRSLEADAREALFEAALQHWPQDDRAHSWRLGLAAILVARDAPLDRVLALAETAIQSPEGAVRDEAIALAAAAHAVRVANADGQSESSRQALAQALAFARRFPGQVQYDARSLALDLGRMLVDLGRRPAAEEALDALRGIEGVQARVLTARALDTLGRGDEAFRAFRAASEAIEYGADNQTYWLVWTRLLELLNAERLRRVDAMGPAAGEAIAGTIRGHLLRLGALDASMGGPPWAGRLGAVEASVGR